MNEALDLKTQYSEAIMTVAATQKAMSKMFDSLSDSFSSTMEACRRSQASWFKSFGDAAKTPSPFDGFGFSNAGQHWVPFMERSAETMTETCDATFGAGFKAAKAATAAMPAADREDFAQGTQKTFEAAITAFGTQMDALNKACVRHTENYTKLMQSAWPCAASSKGCGAKGSGKAGSK